MKVNFNRTFSLKAWYAKIAVEFNEISVENFMPDVAMLHLLKLLSGGSDNFGIALKAPKYRDLHCCSVCGTLQSSSELPLSVVDAW